MSKQLTKKEFNKILIETLSEMKGAEILSYPGIYKILAEELNTKILDIWEERNLIKKPPEPTEEEFGTILCEMIKNMPKSKFFSSCGPYEVLAERYRDEVLVIWHERNSAQ